MILAMAGDSKSDLKFHHRSTFVFALDILFIICHRKGWIKIIYKSNFNAENIHVELVEGSSIIENRHVNSNGLRFQMHFV